MKNKKFRSIRHKLVFLLSLSAVIAILLSSFAIFAYTYKNKKSESVRNLSQLTNILAENLTASIEFDDAKSANDMLKSLKMDSSIKGAFIFKQKGKVFSYYKNKSANIEDTKNILTKMYDKNAIDKKLEHIDFDNIIISSPIHLDGEFIGAFAIVSSTKMMNKTLSEQLFTQFVVALVSILVIVLLAFRLQRIFTLPIFTLKDTMEDIAVNRNYDIHVKDYRDDEFQSLYDGFNNMIDTINNQNNKLYDFGERVKALLDNAGQGFLSFDENFTVDSEFSKECTKLISKDIAGKNIAELLFADNEVQKELFINTIKGVLEQDDDISKKFLLELLPSEIILNKKALKIEYKQIEKSKFMLVITNISSQKKLENKIKKEQEILKMIVETVSDSEMFFETKDEYEKFIDSIASHVDKTKTPLHNFNEVYRTIHTFKGAFSQLYMQNVVKFLHNIESKISLVIKYNKMTNEKLLSILYNDGFANSLNKDLSIITNILGENFLKESNYVKVNVKYIHDLQEKVSKIIEQDEKYPAKYGEVFEKVLELSKIKVINLFKPYSNLVSQLSQNLNKDIYELDVIGDSDITVSEEYKPFFKSLIHMFRNSVDHGIEDAETRVENGKDEKGTISCSFKQNGKYLQIIISDDGGGINKDKIVQKAVEKGIVNKTQAQLLSENEIYNLLFNDQFSTKDEVSEVSGRGVGMSAVKAELEALNGVFEIKSEPNVGSTFTFTLPYENA